MAFPDLSSGDIDAIRRRFIRDLYIPANGTDPAEALSHYNRSTKTQFISDADLQQIAYDVSRAYGDELAGVYSDQYARNVGAGKTTGTGGTADIEATALQGDAFYRLIRASVYELMMLDPGFIGSVADQEQRAALFTSWKQQIIKDRQFTRARTSAAFRSVPIDRY